MTTKKKIKKSLLRLIFPCFSTAADTATATAAAASTAKKRLSTALRDDVIASAEEEGQREEEEEEENEMTSSRPSRTMVTGTILGHRRGRVWFCVQQSDHHHNDHRPMLLVELPVNTADLAAEIRRSPEVRIALESRSGAGPLRRGLVWTAFLNGKRIGPAAGRRRATEEVRALLGAMRATTAGAGVVPAGAAGLGLEEVMYMRARYEHVVGGPHCESFHLVDPDASAGPGHGLSVFLLRSSSAKQEN